MDGTTSTTATPNTISTVVRVALGAAAASIVRCSGSRYGCWATPQPQITATTAPTASGRAPRRAPRARRTSAAAPHSSDAITSGNPSPVRPS